MRTTIWLVWGLLLLCVEGFSAPKYSTDWWKESLYIRGKSAGENRARLSELISTIKLSKYGAEMHRKIEKLGHNPSWLIKFADVSITETVFLRSYSLETGKEDFEIENNISLNRHLSRLDALYDLSHEYKHFIDRKPQNPYRMQMDLGDFIKNGIEGEGGELAAFEAECIVAIQLSKKINIPEHHLCRKYIKGERKKIFDIELARSDFYASGKYYDQLSSLVNKLPQLSNRDSRFNSSLFKIPYPIALMKEYQSVRRAACENNNRKRSLINNVVAQSKSDNSRTINSDLRAEIKRLDFYSKSYCHEFANK